MIVAAAAAVFVTSRAFAARPSAARAEPALKPNQPNHRRPAPRTVIGMSCGSIRSPLHDAPADQQRDDERRDAGRGVDDGAAGEVERAELEQPAVGRPDPVGDRRVDEERPQDREDDEAAPKRFRSAKAPVISAGVIAANISWKAANRTNGIVVA